MAIESKPLFHPEVIRQQVHAFQLPASVAALQPMLQRWAALIASGKADSFKETALLPDFLTDIFCNLLGYSLPAGHSDTFTLSRETHVDVDGKFADAVLGRFGKDRKEYVVALEGKGTRDPLDRPFAGRRMSAVDQAYRYAINLQCDWIIVTSMRETRLYHKGSNQHAYERFETVRLAADSSLLKRFVFLLGAERIVPKTGNCHLYELFKASESVGRELTNQFYALYADIRQKVLTRLCHENPATPPPEILRCTQKLLDRILFCAFCEDRGLLQPPWANTSGKAACHRLFQTFSIEGAGQLNQKAETWWKLSLNQLGDALKQSFKLKTNPMKNPRTADEWEPYLQQKRDENTKLTSALNDAEAELNDRVYRLFDLTPDQIKLLQKEVEH